jgi:hypothetical protein
MRDIKFLDGINEMGTAFSKMGYSVFNNSVAVFSVVFCRTQRGVAVDVPIDGAAAAAECLPAFPTKERLQNY